MKAGNLKILFIILIFFVLNIRYLQAEEKINLNILQPTFEEENYQDLEPKNEVSNIKNKKKNKNLNNTSIVRFRALDKITAKTVNIDIEIGKKKKFGYLEILPKKCSKFEDQNKYGVAAYIQVKDLSDKNEDKVFVFNGWTFSNATNLRTFDHPIYDIWVVGCDNI